MLRTSWNNEEKKTAFFWLRASCGGTHFHLTSKLAGKVLAAAKKLNYVRDGRAASMRSGENREIGFAESWRSSRTLDYNVSLIVLNLDENGRGDGQLMLGAEFVWDQEKNQVVITNFSSEPIRLTRVEQR